MDKVRADFEILYVELGPKYYEKESTRVLAMFFYSISSGLSIHFLHVICEFPIMQHQHISRLYIF